MYSRLVYIETTIPSFCFESRTEPEMVARRRWTREWWDGSGEQYDLVTSAAVIDELEAGDYPEKESVLGLVNDLPLLPVEMPVVDVVEVYIARGVMPNDPVGDALHLALASIHKCDFPGRFDDRKNSRGPTPYLSPSRPRPQKAGGVLYQVSDQAR